MMMVNSRNLLFIVIIFLVISFVLYQNPKITQVITQNGCPNSYTPCQHVAKEAKELSMLLNEAAWQNSKLSCQLATLGGVSARGGWCFNTSEDSLQKHLTDKRIAVEMSKMLKGKRVASFGDGPGHYKQLFVSYDEVISYTAFDGAPYSETVTKGVVKHLDFSVPVYHLPLYDWVISLEVAEHIPKEFEQVFVDNLTRHAKEGIILSWSKIGQGGHSHVNNQDLPYVQEQMRRRGFEINEEKTKILKDATQFHWLKDNTNVYERLVSL